MKYECAACGDTFVDADEYIKHIISESVAENKDVLKALSKD
jgi:hypothetical protein